MKMSSNRGQGSNFEFLPWGQTLNYRFLKKMTYFSAIGGQVFNFKFYILSPRFENQPYAFIYVFINGLAYADS